MVILAVFSAAVWSVAVALAAYGTLLLWRHFKTPQDLEQTPRLEPISILKPVKGNEPGLIRNLESFFHLEYPEYELLFSVADGGDPAVAVIKELIGRYPGRAATLILGDVPMGPNPKVNNCLKSYAAARHDWILISDSNVRVPPDYLRVKCESFTREVGIITAVVCGIEPSTAGGWLEATYLNTFYARWMFIAAAFGQDCVVGKSMLFRKSTAERFGGLAQLGRFLAEDYMAGQAMRQLGLKVHMMRRPIQQPLSRYTIADFWRRHLRWGRIRKAQAPLPVFLEPWTMLFPSGFFGAYGFQKLIGADPFLFFIGHLLIWVAMDQASLLGIGGRFGVRSIISCLIREALSLALWIQIWCGNSVNWRGAILTVKDGGVLEPLESRSV